MSPAGIAPALPLSAPRPHRSTSRLIGASAGSFSVRGDLDGDSLDRVPGFCFAAETKKPPRERRLPLARRARSRTSPLSSAFHLSRRAGLSCRLGDRTRHRSLARPVANLRRHRAHCNSLDRGWGISFGPMWVCTCKGHPLDRVFLRRRAASRLASLPAQGPPRPPDPAPMPAFDHGPSAVAETRHESTANAGIPTHGLWFMKR